MLDTHWRLQPGRFCRSRDYSQSREHESDVPRKLRLPMTVVELEGLHDSAFLT